MVLAYLKLHIKILGSLILNAAPLAGCNSAKGATAASCSLMATTRGLFRRNPNSLNGSTQICIGYFAGAKLRDPMSGIEV